MKYTDVLLGRYLSNCSSGESGGVLLCYTENKPEYTSVFLDHTWNEIHDAMKSGKTVYIVADDDHPFYFESTHRGLFQIVSCEYSLDHQDPSIISDASIDMVMHGTVYTWGVFTEGVDNYLDGYPYYYYD